jgi:two-component system, cell cycle sensor histidine kinase and response regulator CckA
MLDPFDFSRNDLALWDGVPSWEPRAELSVATWESLAEPLRTPDWDLLEFMPKPLLNTSAINRPALRISLVYATLGLLWIWLSDLALIWLGYADNHGYFVSAAKGSSFVVFSAALLFWLVRREIAAVRRSDNLLRAVVDGTADAVFVKDLRGCYRLINRAAAGFVGKPVEDVLGRDDTHLFDAVEAERVMSRDRAILAGNRVVTVEDTLVSGGVRRTYHTTSTPYRDETGEVIGLIGISRDISERKQAEEALRESEARFRELADAIPQIVFTAGPDGGLIHLNAQTASYTGLGTNDLLGWSWDKVIHPDDLPHTVAVWTTAVGSGVPRELEFRIRRADGVYRWHVSRQVPARAADGSISRWYGTCTDIDDLKRTEAALRESDARLREAQRIASLGSWSWEPPTGHVWWSDAEFELFGIDRGAVEPSFGTFLSLVHPDHRAVAVARVEAMLSGAEEFADDLRIVRPDGTTLWIHSQARATRDAEGTLIRVEGIDQDITRRRLAEMAARESDERLQAAIAVAGLGVIAIDYGHQTATLSAQAAEQFGLPSGTSISRSDLHARIHPEDRAEVDRLTTGALNPGGTGRFTLEHRIIRPDGTIRWLNVRKQVSFVAGRPHRGVVLTADVTEHRQAEVRLQEQEMLVREAAELAQVGGWGFDPVTLQSDWTPEVSHIYGVDAPPPVSEALKFFSPAQRPALEAALAAAIQDGTPHDMELQLTAADGQTKWVRTICRPIVEAGRVLRVRGSIQDITDRKRLESQFLQSQKMEAIGRLAGGVAHDFNNMLTVINVCCEVLLMTDELVVDDWRESVSTILDAGQRAAHLTQQLLAFSRKAIVEPKVIDLNELVTESVTLLRCLVGERVLLEVLTAPTPVRVLIDPNQFEQVIMNLAVNARDAMPLGGRLTISTAIVPSPVTDSAASAGASSELPSGTFAQSASSWFACLSLADTGHGMTDEVKGKVFEPFFTTKGVGKGTGLGLSVVHGVVSQSGGQIALDSAVGVGTTFRLLLPLVADEPVGPMPDAATVASRGAETILLVEDEDAVRTIVRLSLETRGYTVLEAASGVEAVRYARTHAGPIDLLVSDVVMPEMGGRQLAEALRRDRPDVRVLFMSGYADDAVLRHGGIEATNAFIQKPFTPLGLARKVRELIDVPVA